MSRARAVLCLPSTLLATHSPRPRTACSGYVYHATPQSRRHGTRSTCDVRVHGRADANGVRQGEEEAADIYYEWEAQYRRKDNGTGIGGKPNIYFDGVATVVE
mmetsp:Transcript_568/g.2018  ORF Transcript_568/g.2018 Transcript_568/m.2018 type:complete len:103 (+) Transcript_568:1634-1942(+)